MTRRLVIAGVTVVLGLSSPRGSLAGSSLGACPPDAVRVGTLCVDRYEASLWSIDPVGKKRLV